MVAALEALRDVRVYREIIRLPRWIGTEAAQLIDGILRGAGGSWDGEIKLRPAGWGFSMMPVNATYALWGAWLASWTVASFWSNRTEKRDAIAAEFFFRVLFYGGLVLLFAFPPSHSYRQTQLWQFGRTMNWILVGATAVG